MKYFRYPGITNTTAPTPSSRNRTSQLKLLTSFASPFSPTYSKHTYAPAEMSHHLEFGVLHSPYLYLFYLESFLLCFLFYFCLEECQVSKGSKNIGKEAWTRGKRGLPKSEILERLSSSTVDVGHHLRRKMSLLFAYEFLFVDLTLKTNYSPVHLTHLCPPLFILYAVVVQLFAQPTEARVWFPSSVESPVDYAQVISPTHTGAHTHTQTSKPKCTTIIG